LSRYLDVALGAALLLAGALKTQHLLVNPSAGRVSGFPREVLIGAAAFELTFGCWLLAGLYRRLTRYLALAWFTSLAAALAQAIGGVSSCACLGELRTSPWLMLSFDVAALAALHAWSPNDHPSRRRLPVVLCLSILPAMVSIGLAEAVQDKTTFAEIDLGEIAQGGQRQQAFRCCNDSGELIELATIKANCPCASIHLDQTHVPAGKCLAGNVVLDLRPRPEFVGDLVVEARGLTHQRRVAFVLAIRARVCPESQRGTDSYY
jgi:hypothetical protein